MSTKSREERRRSYGGLQCCERQVTGPAHYAEYVEKAPALIARYGGKYLARAGEVEALEGERHPQRLVILECESMERFKEWYNSPEYTPLKQLRREASVTEYVVVEGL